MSAKSLVAFRSSIEKGKLEEFALKKLHYRSVSEFINEAVKEKISRETVVTTDPEMDRLIDKIREVVYEHKGWKFLKVSPAAAKRIDRIADPIIQGKVKGTPWTGSLGKAKS